MALSKAKNFKNFISFWFCDVNSAIHIRLSFLFQLYRLHFFYKQLVYKQLALSLKIAKQLWGLNHLAISNNIKLQITDNRFEKDCLRVNQSLKIFIVKPMLSSNSPPPTPHPLLQSVKTGIEYCMILGIL